MMENFEVIKKNQFTGKQVRTNESQLYLILSNLNFELSR